MRRWQAFAIGFLMAIVIFCAFKMTYNGKPDATCLYGTGEKGYYTEVCP